MGMGLVVQHLSGDGDHCHKLSLPDVSGTAERDNNVWLAVLVAVLHSKVSVVDPAGVLVVVRR